MKPTIYRRIRRRTASHETATAKKDNQLEQSFFGEATHEAFFQPASIVQRKCEDCEKDEKEMQRQPDKKEEDKKLMKLDDKKEEDKKIMKMDDKKEEDKKLQKMDDKKEEDKKLMKMDDKKEEDKKLMKMDDKKEEDKKLQKKEVGQASGTGNISGYVNSLNGKGNPMSAKAKHFFSSRMGYDFSNVKIHDGAEAAESAKAINAKAYAIGNNIVFNEGQFNEESGEGKKILAHELTHVMQNENQSEFSLLNRKADFKTSQPLKDVDMAANYLTAAKQGNTHVGITTPYLNGHDLTKPISGYPVNLPAEKDLTAVTGKDNYKSSVTNEPVNTFTYIMHIPVNKKIWKEFIDGNAIKAQLKKPCPGMVNVYIEGDPDSKTIVEKIQAHEEIHVAHWKELFTSIIEPLDKRIKNATAFGKTDVASKKSLLKFLEVISKSAYDNFIAQYQQKAADFHSTAGGASAEFKAYSQDPDCMWIKVKVTI